MAHKHGDREDDRATTKEDRSVNKDVEFSKVGKDDEFYVDGDAESYVDEEHNQQVSVDGVDSPASSPTARDTHSSVPSQVKTEPFVWGTLLAGKSETLHRHE